MVDFTKSISNEQMTSGLKRLLAISADIETQCANLRHEGGGGEERSNIETLESMCQRHRAWLSDSLHFLGAAADSHKRANRRDHFPKADGAPVASGDSFPKPQLKAYRKACLEELERLKASDEVVNTVNRILDDLGETSGGASR